MGRSKFAAKATRDLVGGGHRMRAAFRALVAGSLAAGFVALAVADAEAAVNAKVRRACASDYKRLCPAYKVGSNQLRACMESKSSEISSNCIDALIDAGEVDRRRARR